MLRRILAGAFLLSFLALAGSLIHGALQPEKLPIGAPMPRIDYLTESAVATLYPDTAHTTMVVYFHSDCKPCRRQLQALDENSEFFAGTRIVLLTDEKDFFAKRKMNSWPKLIPASNVIWSIAKAEHIQKYFGAQSTPTIYVFDKAGMVSAKIIGETKTGKILHEVRKARR